MKILVLMSTPRIGGAQYSTLEFLEFLRSRAEIYVAIRKDAPREIMFPLEKLGVEVLQYTYKEIFNYPYLDIKAINKKVDVIWVADQTFLNIPKLKRILDVPVVVHLRDYAFICPWWTASYGLKEICLRRCSLLRLIKCKQLANRYMADEGLISKFRSNLYQALNTIKGIGDYYTWPLRNKEVLNNVDGFIAVSQAVKDIYRSHDILKPIKVIYNPVKASPSDINDTDNYICRDDEIVLTYASGANLIKGPHILLKAVRKLITNGLKLHVVMIGVKGTWVEKLVMRLDLSKHVNLLPKLPRSRVYSIMKHSNLVIFPSIWPEPFGRVALEANLLKIPVVASNIGGLPEVVIDGITGILVKPNDPKSLADGIVKALGTKFDSENIKRKTEEKFIPELQARELLKFFENILKIFNEGDLPCTVA